MANKTQELLRTNLQSGILFFVKQGRGKKNSDTFTSWVVCHPFVSYLSIFTYKIYSGLVGIALPAEINPVTIESQDNRTVHLFNN